MPSLEEVRDAVPRVWKAAFPLKSRRERDPRDIWTAETKEVAEKAFASRDSRNRTPFGPA